MPSIRFLALALLALVATGCDAGEDVTVIRLGHGLDRTHSVHQGMEFMAQRVAEKSNGRMRIDIYPSGQLGTEREALELLQIGSLGMTKVASAALEGFAPRYQVLSLPYLFRDEGHRFRVLEGPIGKEILQQGEEFWLRGLVFYDAGSRSFYTKQRPIEKPDDLRGLKIRTLESPSQVAMVNQLGGAATPISWGELYTALQQGVVDGAENNPPSFYLSRHYEVAKFYSLDEHTALPDVLIVSTKVWEDLTPQERRWLQEAAEESVGYQKQLWKQSTEEALRAVQEAGVEIIHPDKESFAAKVEPLYEAYRSDPEMHRLIERIQAAE